MLTSLQAAAAAAGARSPLGAVPFMLRCGVHGGMCERSSRLVLPLGACLCVDGQLVARCAALGYLALDAGAPVPVDVAPTLADGLAVPTVGPQVNKGP